MIDCILCGERVEHYAQDKRRSYLECSRCALVQVPEEQRLSLDDEKGEYDKHENTSEDLGYRRFLSRMLEPMLEALSGRISSNLKGLDFGSGPEPVLQKMFKDKGLNQQIYDAFYATDLAPLDASESYDFITATEVVEHLYNPQLELDRLWSLLDPKGVLGIMTKRVTSNDAFQQWHYKNDPTHVCFFSIRTFEYLAEKWGAELKITSPDVVLFTKKL